jgi:hypothetical protein
MTNQVERFIVAIRNAKIAYPELRIGQIISNAIRDYDGQPLNDPFYIEDKGLCEYVENFLKNHGANKDV